MDVENLECDELRDDQKTNDSYDAIHDIIDYLVRDINICFKSQQIGEEDLKISEKKTIAFDVFNKSALYFLEKYGKYLKMEHLPYFEDLSKMSVDDNEELNYHIAQLKLILNKAKQKVLVKNRRFEALSKMIKDDTYFSETEMMHRKPLLYEQLVGQFMTDAEKLARDNIDRENISLLNVLLEGIDRRNVKSEVEELKRIEDVEMKRELSDNEMSSSSDEESKNNVQWGEFSNTKRKVKKKVKVDEIPSITAPERELLREEFVQEMYRSFLDGEDDDFDYQSIDANADYDCIVVRGRDEEENYFDSESPDKDVTEAETVNDTELGDNMILHESDDELEVYMIHLNRHLQ
ncbi:coiled-coil domain-containing protein 97 [Arctopsyche grandis]|uniref:coiled-coil domain-containing protein 97 n=1 Tax=Arctopsyche grandis TaxID=121162 RepID=UPI00406D972C